VLSQYLHSTGICRDESVPVFFAATVMPLGTEAAPQTQAIGISIRGGHSSP